MSNLELVGEATREVVLKALAGSVHMCTAEMTAYRMEREHARRRLEQLDRKIARLEAAIETANTAISVVVV